MIAARLFRVAALGVVAAFAVPASADAVQMRFFDPSSSSWQSYDTDDLDGAGQQSRGPDAAHRRQIVDYATDEAPGTIVVDTENKFLYYVLDGGQAIRFGVGVGREGFGWSGEVHVGRMAEWPSWTPPAQMIERRPELVAYADGMPGGEDNPLGARALYLYDGGSDTMYRIHGTNEPWSIGGNVSSGCIRMLNEDVTELYSLVDVGTRVVVI
jgi:lipoprotein-anchoring transpeptidase ErfK/SrfK